MPLQLRVESVVRAENDVFPFAPTNDGMRRRRNVERAAHHVLKNEHPPHRGDAKVGTVHKFHEFCSRTKVKGAIVAFFYENGAQCAGDVDVGIWASVDLEGWEELERVEVEDFTVHGGD